MNVSFIPESISVPANQLKFKSETGNQKAKTIMQKCYFEEAPNSAQTVKQKWQEIKELGPFFRKTSKINN